MCYTVAYLAWSPLTGVWSDLLQRHVVSLLVFCSGALTCIYLIMILLPVPKGLLVWLYLAKCMLHMQMSSAGWKVGLLFSRGFCSRSCIMGPLSFPRTSGSSCFL